MTENTKRVSYILCSVFVLILLLTSSCKQVAKVEINELYASAIKIIGEEKSNFSAFASIYNETSGVEVEIENWSFKVYSSDTLLFEVNNTNYQDLE